MVRRAQYTLFFVLLVLSGCGDSYEPTRRELQVPTFKVIRLHSVFSVVLEEANTHSIEITADEDIINDIKVTVVNDTLELTDKSKFKWTSPESTHIQIKINAPSFSSVIAEQSYSLSNSGTLFFDEFYIWNYPEVKISDINLMVAGNYLYYWNNWLAGGKLAVKGAVETFYASNYALHIIDAQDLQASNATLHNFGREKCSVNVSEHFEYSLRGPGDIVLYGDPAEVILLEKTSTGKLIRGH